MKLKFFKQEKSKSMLISLAYLGFFIIGIVFIWLVNLNWGPTVRTTLFSVVLGGMTTVLVAILSNTKNPTDIEEKFPNNFYFNMQTKLLDNPSGEPHHPEFYQKIWMTNTAPSLESLPKDDMEASDFIGELLQYKILTDLKGMGLDSVSIIFAGGIPSFQSHATVMKRPKDTALLPLSSINMLNNNRFLIEEIARIEEDKKKFTSKDITAEDRKILSSKIDYSALPIPNGTTVSIQHTKDKAEYQVILEKTSYFRITFTLQSLGILSGGTNPDFRAIPYSLNMSAKFDSLSASGFKSAEYREWANWIITDFKEKWAKYK